MRYIVDIAHLEQNQPSVVTIGKFDGFHRGHQALIRQALQDRKPGEQMIVLTFSQPPQNVICGKPQATLLTRQEKVSAAEALGVDVLAELPFNDELRHMQAERFLQHILREKLRAEEIIAGPDLRFGYERRGDRAFLERCAAEEGFRLHIVEKELYKGKPVSSTRIRQALAQGKAEDAARMLGRPYSFHSVVSHGKQKGRQLGFPTLNQEIPPDKVLPAFGVYAAQVYWNGNVYRGVANVGIKPTVTAFGAASVETHVFDFRENLYGQKIKTEICHFIRPEMRFHSLEALTEQIRQDSETTRRYWQEIDRKKG